MNAKNLWLKLGIVGMLVGFCCVSLFWGKGLRQGIDLKGGHSLIFEIRSNQPEINRLKDQIAELEVKLQTVQVEAEKKTLEDRLDRAKAELRRYEYEEADKLRGDLAQKMISILKERVDKHGLLSLEWRPMGSNRIEIRMPAARAESQEYRAAYLEALERLETNNIERSEIRNVLQSAASERAAKIQRLARGSAAQTRRFQELIDAYDQMTASDAERRRIESERTQALQASASSAKLNQLEKALEAAQAAFEDTQVLYEDKLKALQEGNIGQARLQAILSNYVPPAQEKTFGSIREVARRREDYKKQLEELEGKHPDRADEIEKIVALYERWASVRQRLDDPADLKRLIAKAGVLEYRIAPYAPGPGKQFVIGLEERNRYIKNLRTEGPEGPRKRSERLQWFPVHGQNKEYDGLVTANYEGRTYILLFNQPGYVMLHEPGPGGWSLADARFTYDKDNRPAVGFTFDEAGAKRFARLTSDNVGRCLAVLLDDEVYSAPRIREMISAQGVITGQFSVEEVDDLVRTLEAGSLPARLNPEPVAENTFGPGIGAVNRQLGIRAAIWGLVVVAAFMLIYYQLAGVIADVALLLNVILVLGTMSLINAVFTLPGIAGMILTIGIAVDANVLIFERLREEQAKGQTIRQALKNAYERAFSAIFDANITTLLVCLILGWVGTEEVRGFAITLGLGVMFSMFTALVVTRWIFQILLDLRLLKKPVFMLKIIGTPKVNWMSKRYVFWLLTIVFIALGIASLFGQGSDIWGIEFSAGTQAVIAFRDDALIDNKLPDDAIVRDKFIAQAKKLGYDKLQATALVETQINPNRVRDFLRDYDDKQNPDGKISVDEWQAAKLNPKFFEKIDSNGDGNLTRDELAKNLPANSYQISTTETYLDYIRRTARDAFGRSLQIRTRRKFERVKGREMPVLGIKMPPDGALPLTQKVRRRVKATYREELLDFEGGVMFVIHDVSPPISKTELVQRIREMRFQPDFRDQMLSPTEVIGLKSLGEDEFSAFALLVRPAEGAAVEKPEAWESFVKGEWELLSAALDREEAMVASNFDPAIAGERAGRAIFAILLSWVVIVIYLWFRFGDWRWGLAAVVCLIHDVIIVVGLVAASSWISETYIGELLGIRSFKIDLAMVAAILTVIGYSVNDTIVVFDRTRENRGKLATVSGQVINASINQTLARTLLTSGTTFFVVMIMYVMGGVGIHAFNYALLAGILFGTYSSVAVASPLLMGFRKALVAKVTA